MIFWPAHARMLFPLRLTQFPEGKSPQKHPGFGFSIQGNGYYETIPKLRMCPHTMYISSPIIYKSLSPHNEQASSFWRLKQKSKQASVREILFELKVES